MAMLNNQRVNGINHDKPPFEKLVQDVAGPSTVQSLLASQPWRPPTTPFNACCWHDDPRRRQWDFLPISSTLNNLDNQASFITWTSSSLVIRITIYLIPIPKVSSGPDYNIRNISQQWNP